MSDVNDNEKRMGQWGPRQEQRYETENRQWAALRRRYEWQDSYDDESIAPRDVELENELFGEENHVNTGINFDNYNNIAVSVKNAKNEIKPIQTFDEANLHEVMKENVRLAKYKIPTPVQKYSIPIITEKYDLMACAQTGSGKTAAFLIPVLSQLFGKAKKISAPRAQPGIRRFKAEPLVLILAPTRELATQIFDECRKFTYRSMMRPCVVYGGADSNPQKSELAKGCDVLTATPGRLNDFLDRGFVTLRRVRYLVLDEADRMLELGFEEDIRKIVQKSDILDDGTRQTLMFSATFPRKIRELARDFLSGNYIFLTVGRVGGTTSDITQKIIYVEDEKKRNQLVQMLLRQPPSRTLVFVKSKRGADSLDDYLYNQGFPSTSIHGDRTQREREDALMSFKSGRSPILIATAVAARGLDIKNVMHVINFDLCDNIEEYVHRIGRTARVGNKGLATSFYNDKNADIAGELVRILVECNQEVPEFLQSYENEIQLDDDEEWENNKSSGRDGYKNSNDQRSWDSNQTPSRDVTRNSPQWDPTKPLHPKAYQHQQTSNSYAQDSPQNQPPYTLQPERGSPVVNLPKANNQYNSATPPQSSFGYDSPQTYQQNFGSGGYRHPQNNNNFESNTYHQSNRNADFGNDNDRNQRRPPNSGNVQSSNNNVGWGSTAQEKKWDPKEVPW